MKTTRLILTSSNGLPQSLHQALPHSTVLISAMPLMCIQAESPSSAEARFGSLSITGRQGLFWISGFHKPGPSPLPAYLARIGSKQNTRVPEPFYLVDSPTCLDSCMLWIPRTAQWTEGWSHTTTFPVFLFFPCSTDYSDELKHAAVLCVRGERHDSIVFRSCLGRNTQKQSWELEAPPVPLSLDKWVPRVHGSGQPHSDLLTLNCTLLR